MRVFGTLGLLAALAVATPASAAACVANGAQVGWSVLGRFRLLDTSEAASARADRLLERIAAAGTMAAAYPQIIDAVTTAPSPGAQGENGKQLFELTYYDRRTEMYGRGRTRAEQEADLRAFLQPATHRIRASFPSAQGAVCVWSVPGQAAIQGACASTVLAVPMTWSKPAQATQVGVQVKGASQSAMACVLIRDTLMVGMGESFAAGEGNPDKPADWSRLDEAALKRVQAEYRAKVTANDRKSKHPALWWYEKSGDAGFLPRNASAEWWDNTCHRSLLSQHAQAALRYAANHPQETVTFLSFACSGATVAEGFAGPRVDPPGWKRLQDPGLSPQIMHSQVNQLVQTLCADREDRGLEMVEVPSNVRYWDELPKGSKAAGPGQKVFEVGVQQCGEWLRKPDVILMSLGGNDIGFGGVGAWTVMPPSDRRRLITKDLNVTALINRGVDIMSSNPGLGVVCPIHIPGQVRCEPGLGEQEAYTAAELLRSDLPEMLKLADKVLDKAALGDVRLVSSTYPNPVRDEHGYCGALGSDVRADGARWTPLQQPWRGNLDLSEPWMAQYSTVLSLVPKAELRGQWTLGARNRTDVRSADASQPEALADRCPLVDGTVYNSIERETCIIDTHVLGPLNDGVIAAARTAGWDVLDPARMPASNGICAHSVGAVAATEGWTNARDVGPRAGSALLMEFGWPRWDEGKGWRAAYPKPQDWRPYADRPRWFRTGNDSALTSFVAGRGQDGATESVSGALHPTARMHGALADLIFEKLSQAGPR